MTSTLTAPRPVRSPVRNPVRSPIPSGLRSGTRVHRVTTARPARPARSARRPVRLTRRGRLLLLAALVALAFSLASLGAAVWASGPATAGSGGPVARHWVVQPGESLWQVAMAVAPDADPRDTVARIIDMNGLQTATVTAGQTLLVPATPR